MKRHRGGTSSTTQWVKQTRFRVQGVSAPAGKAIMYALADYVDAENSTWLGVDALAELADVSVRSVKRFIVGAREAGWLCTKPRMRPDGRGRDSDRMYLHVDGETLFCGCDQSANSAPEKPEPKCHPGHDQSATQGKNAEPAQLLSEPARGTRDSGGKPPKPTDDPRRAAAHKLTVLAFEQPVKPTIAGGNGRSFVAVLDLFDAALAAGRSVQEIERAVLAGIDVWTTQGLNTALAQQRRRPGKAAERETAYDVLGDRLAKGGPK